jgi:hypothetical protein
MNPIQEKISPCLTKRLTSLDNFLLMKINEDGKLEWNLEEVETLAKSYDLGVRTEDTKLGKIVSLVWQDGYCCAMDDVEDKQQKMILLMTCVGGNA